VEIPFVAGEQETEEDVGCPARITCSGEQETEEDVGGKGTRAAGEGRTEGGSGEGGGDSPAFEEGFMTQPDDNAEGGVGGGEGGGGEGGSGNAEGTSKRTREAAGEEAEAQEGRGKRARNAEVAVGNNAEFAGGSAGGTERVEMQTPANEGGRESTDGRLSTDGLPFFSPPGVTAKNDCSFGKMATPQPGGSTEAVGVETNWRWRLS
jgi:hypothetical protein